MPKKKNKNLQARNLYPAQPGLKIIPLGGCEEVGRNMTVFEYGKDIVILDMGLQFPNEDMPGVDYIIPNTKYLEGKEKEIKGVIFTHGHLDHIGAAPILLEKLGNPLVIGRDLTVALIKDRQENYKPQTANKLKVRAVKSLKDIITLGNFTVKFFRIKHSIMDAVGVVFETPAATVIHPGDWTMERDKHGEPRIDYSHLRNLPKPTILMLESLGAIREGQSAGSKEVYNNLYQIIKKAEGRVIIGTFASQIERIRWILEISQRFYKKVVLDGYSLKRNVEISRKLGYIKADKELVIDVKKINAYPDQKLVILCTGAQGEENAVLSRIVNKEHHFIKLTQKDTVVFSSSVIPGNERIIAQLKDNIYRQSDHVIHSEIMDVHISGHATRRDITDMIKIIDPTYFIPVYANHYFLKEAANAAIRNGFSKNHIIVPDNGSIIFAHKREVRVLSKKVPTDYVFVDGLGISDMENVVLRDRQVLAEDGMVVVIVIIHAKTGKLARSPDIISRGFVFLKENKKLIEALKIKVRRMVLQSSPKTWADTIEIKNILRERVGQFLFSQTQKRPMILPVVIEV